MPRFKYFFLIFFFFLNNYKSLKKKKRANSNLSIVDTVSVGVISRIKHHMNCLTTRYTFTDYIYGATLLLFNQKTTLWGTCMNGLVASDDNSTSRQSDSSKRRLDRCWPNHPYNCLNPFMSTEISLDCRIVARSSAFAAHTMHVFAGIQNDGYTCMDILVLTRHVEVPVSAKTNFSPSSGLLWTAYLV